MESCRVHWGTHGCCLRRGHHPGSPHVCACCACKDHDGDHEENGCVACPPYYGPETKFYGEDA